MKLELSEEQKALIHRARQWYAGIEDTNPDAKDTQKYLKFWDIQTETGTDIEPTSISAVQYVLTLYMSVVEVPVLRGEIDDLLKFLDSFRSALGV